MKYIFEVLLCLFSFSVFAQENYEIQVYASPTMARRQTIFELHSNYTFLGGKDIKDGVLPSYHSIHETIEITHGIADNFELGFYLFTNYTPNYGWQIIGTHIRPRIAAPEKWKLPVGLSLSAEIGWQKQEYSAETFSLEIRPIIDKTLGNLYLAFNPVLSVTLSGIDQPSAPSFAPNLKAAYAVSPKICLGTEYYGNLGPLNQFEKIAQQNHAFFVVADLYVDPKWEVNFGPGFGLTESTDGFVMKLILGRRITWAKKRK